MKIALVGHAIPSTGSGVSMGIARYIYSLGTEFRSRGNEVELFIRNDRRPEDDWIKTVYAPKFSWIPYPFFVRRKLRGVSADVFHSDFITTGSAIVKAGKRPAVVSMHDAIPFTYDIKNMPRSEKLGTKWYMRCFRTAAKADAVILMSEYARSEAIRLAGLDPDKTFAVHNGIDHGVFRPMKSNRKSSENIRIGYLGGLDGRKNVKLLVDVFKALYAERDDIELHIAGGGANLEKFRSMNISNATFYGPTDPAKAPEFYNNIDIFVMPSLQEGFGMMTLEAMSCGVATIGVDRTSTPEIIGDAGVLVKPDASALAKAISRLADNKKLRDRVAAACLKRSASFSWKRCATDTMKVYGEAMK